MNHQISHYLPTRLLFGRGCIGQAAGIIAGFGGRALLVTGRTSMDSLGICSRLIDDLANHHVEVVRFSGLENTPTTDVVDCGVETGRRSGVDVIVALGGGSVMDAAKAIAGVMSTQATAADVLYGRAAVAEGVPSLVCIPTTAGTGSEVNRSAIVTDPDVPIKDGIRSDFLFPRVALVDSELTWTLPPRVTAETGFDALAHAIESYVSPKSSSISDALSRQSIGLIGKWLPTVLDRPSDALARDHVSMASTMMGINLATVGTCFPHRADKSLGAICPAIAHGQCVAFFYAYWLHSCEEAAAEKLADVARLLDPDHCLPQQTAPEVILRFIDRLGISKDIRQFGITEAAIPALVRGVRGDLTVNPVAIRTEDLYSIFQTILRGDCE